MSGLEKVTEQENETIKQGKCPDCGGELYITARGGLALNVACDCGAKFWVAYPFKAERIAKGVNYAKTD